MTQYEASTLLARCNHTELFQICRKAGIPVLPNYPRELLIALLEGFQEPQPVRHSVDDWRDAIMTFVDEYYAKLRAQLTCPAQTRDPKACYGCVDAQVYACLIENEQGRPFIEKYYQLRKKTTT